MVIDEETIFNLIATEIQQIIQSDSDTFGGYEFNITNEQQFIKDRTNQIAKNQPKKIFIVIKNYPATLNFGQVLMPIQLDVISEQNKLDISKRLMTLFAETYNLEFDEDYTIKQYYQSPSVLSNFNEIGNGFRSLLTLRGTLQISEDSNIIKTITLVDDDTEINIPFITSNASFDVQLETQSLYGQSNITKSWARVGTLVLNFSIYLTDTDFCNNILYLIMGDEDNMPDGINTDFNFVILFKNELSISKTYKLVNGTIEQNMGELPVINLTFTL